ncbi:O-antigen ligase family protein [Vibrio inusitatus]|uniref:O-antigen ligase family protein n=1 Tax=Vibrio inusitatus TaxID=413402 RepID=UPI001142A478|nr:O-antigen ligase family protein [Vibrio inusitatus]
MKFIPKLLTDNLVVLSLVGISLFSFNLFILPDQPVLLYDYKRIFFCTLIITSCLLLTLSNSIRQDAINKLTSLSPLTLSLLCLFFIFSFISNMFGLYPSRGFIDLFYYTGIFILILALSNNNTNKLNYELFSLISILCYLSVFIGFTVTNLYGDGSSIWTILSYGNPRMLNQVQVWLIIPSIYIALITKSKKSYIPIILNFSTMYALDARGLFIAVIFGIGLWCLINKEKRISIIKIVISCLIISYFIKLITLSPIPSLIFHGKIPESLLGIRTSDSGRIELWKHALEMVTFWGKGGDAFVCNSILNSRPHNSVLLIMVNWGLIPALLYSCLIVKLFLKTINTKSLKLQALGVTILSGISYSLISGVLDSPFSLLLGCILLSIYWGVLLRKNSCKYKKNILNTNMHSIIIVISILSLSAISFKLTERISNNFYLADEFIPEIYKPQFWLGNNCILTK